MRLGQGRGRRSIAGLEASNQERARRIFCGALRSGGWLLFWLDDEVRSPACMYCKPGRGPDSHSVRYERVLKLDQPSFARMILSDVLYCTVPPLRPELSL